MTTATRRPSIETLIEAAEQVEAVRPGRRRLQIAGLKAGELANLREHGRTDLVVIMKSEDNIGPALAGESPMGA